MKFREFSVHVWQRECPVRGIKITLTYIGKTPGPDFCPIWGTVLYGRVSANIGFTVVKFLNGNFSFFLFFFILAHSPWPFLLSALLFLFLLFFLVLYLLLLLLLKLGKFFFLSQFFSGSPFIFSVLSSLFYFFKLLNPPKCN